MILELLNPFYCQYSNLVKIDADDDQKKAEFPKNPTKIGLKNQFQYQFQYLSLIFIAIPIDFCYCNCD